MKEYNAETINNRDRDALSSSYSKLYINGFISKDELVLLLIFLHNGGSLKTKDLRRISRLAPKTIKSTMDMLQNLSLIRIINENVNIIFPEIIKHNVSDDILSLVVSTILKNREKYNEGGCDIRFVTEFAGVTIDPNDYINYFMKQVETIPTKQNDENSPIIDHPVVVYKLPEKTDAEFWWHINAYSIIDIDDPDILSRKIDTKKYLEVIKYIESFMGINAVRIFRSKWNSLHSKRIECIELIEKDRESMKTYGVKYEQLMNKKKKFIDDACKDTYRNYEEYEYQDLFRCGIDFMPFTDYQYMDKINYSGEIDKNIYREISIRMKSENSIIGESILRDGGSDEIIIEQETVKSEFKFINSDEGVAVRDRIGEEYFNEIDMILDHKTIIEKLGGSEEEYLSQVLPLVEELKIEGKNAIEAAEEISVAYNSINLT